MAQKISNLAVGSKIKITGSKYAGNSAGKPYEMIVAAKSHAGYTGGVVLVTEFAAKYCAFDAKEPTNPNTNIQANGNARYLYSNLLQWLNSDSLPWYVSKHTYDREPAEAYVSQSPYSTQRGFMSHFPTSFSDLLLDVHAVSLVAGGAGRETVTSKWAIPSVTEMFGTSELADRSEGSQFSYFSTAEHRKCTLNSGEVVPSNYYTRTPQAESDGSATRAHQLVAVVANTGSRSNAYPQNGDAFVRPFCLVSNDALVSDASEDGYYSMVYNAAPTPPTSITVPTAIEGGTSATIGWGVASDPESNLAGYVLERSVAGGAWTQIYRGTLRSYSDAITFGWTSVTYRVKGYDVYGAESDYTTSATRAIANNSAPTISGTNGALGTFGAAFTAQAYTVTDAQSDAVTVVERLDGVTKRSYTAALGAANSFAFTAAEWQQILNGNHTITVTATDSKGKASVRTWTFVKAQNSLQFTITPLPADDMPDRCVVGAVGNFPTGSTITVEVCNNAKDATPMWENITAKLGQKHFFANRSKTAASWAFGLRVSLNRGTATGAVWLDYININFR